MQRNPVVRNRRHREPYKRSVMDFAILGVGAYQGRLRRRFAVLSFNPGRKTIPFVTGGYSLAFRDGAINLIHYGGGFNHWFNDRWGMRFEVRNHTQTRSAEYQLLQFRVAFLFR